MGHLLEKQLVAAFICLSLAKTIPATRKEDLERAAELAVERAAERAAERAVEKALEAGNTTSTTITVKESYSNARKTAEEQAAPGSESTRYQDEETSNYESKDFDESPDYESTPDELDYTDYNDTKSYSGDDDFKEYGDDNESRIYSHYNDSRESDDFNDSRNYEKYYGKGYREYKESDSYRNLNDSKDYEDSDDFGGSKEHNLKSSRDHSDPKSYENEEDYLVLNETDYKKLNTSKSSVEMGIPGTFEDFEWSSNDSDFRKEFGSKLPSFGSKLGVSASVQDPSFYSAETDFPRKRSSEKEDEDEETEDEDDDSWKSDSEWQKDFKSKDISDSDDETFSKGSFWDEEEESSIKTSRPFWTDDKDILPSETGNSEKENPENGENSKKKKASRISTDKSSRDKDFDFDSDISSPSDDDDHHHYQHEDEDDDDISDEKDKDDECDIGKSKLDSGSSNDDLDKKTMPYHLRQSRDESQRKYPITTTTEKMTSSAKTTTARTTRRTADGNSRILNNSNKEVSEGSSQNTSRSKYNRGYEGGITEINKKRTRSGNDAYEKRDEVSNVEKPKIITSLERNNQQRDSESSQYGKQERLPGNVRGTNFLSHRLERYDRSKSTNSLYGGYENVSEDVRKPESRPYKNEKNVKVYVALPMPTPQPYTSEQHLLHGLGTSLPLKVEKKTTGRIIPPASVPVDLLQGNFPESPQENFEKPSFVQFPSDVPDTMNDPKNYPSIPSTRLTVPKPNSKDSIDLYSQENEKMYSRQLSFRIPKQHRQLVMNEQLPENFKMAPFRKMTLPGEKIRSPVEKSLPINIHADKPYTIHLDNSVPVALEKRIPFVIHGPLKSDGDEKWTENRHPIKNDNVAAESQNWLQKIRWLTG